MANIYSIPLSDIVSEFNLDFFYKSSDFDKIHVTVDEVSRPGLHLAGFFDHFEPMRIYVCGTVEVAYLQKLSSEERSIIFDHFLSYMCPALIFSRGFQPTPECLEMAKKYNVTVLGCREATSYLVSALIVYLKSALAPRVTRHGVLVEIYGEGVLINGDSGIGKSETAIELVKRGHRLIADDAVEIKKVSSRELMGAAPEVLRHYIEIRGIGVINVAKLFGMGAVKDATSVDLIVNMVPWRDGEVYDRLGMETQYTEILGVKVPSVTIPITPGRNLAVIL
ncbi:MAG: HPr(Ser) kinase/phosphatase, partial [Clostridia bacterium]|nr:HPr(Ser) kinase/phosphatase [Clostridia bacterium]